MQHPQWALAHKKKGTELRCIRGKYYLYEISSRWDKEKKRSVKVTGKCIGSISESGITPSKNRNSKIDIDSLPIKTKNYASYSFFLNECKDWIVPLKKYFPDSWEQLLCMAYTRLFHKSPIKNMPFYFEQSFLSEQFKDLPFSDKTIGNVLNDTGRNQYIAEQFLKEFIPNDRLVLVDATPIFSKSKNIYEAKLGYNNKKRWESQINLLYLYDPELALPLFYRLSPGDIREVKTLEMAILSAGLKNAVVVGDKGFTSELNMNIIEQNDFSFILPLRRNSSYIDYTGIDGTKTKFEGFFKYKDRYIWYKQTMVNDNRRVIVFLDEQLRISEEKDYLDRIEKKHEKYDMEGFYQKQNSMGTISMIDNVMDKSPQEIFFTYKSRCEIEQLFDIFKNELNADRTYIHSIESLKGWMFINHLALTAYYRVYKLLKDKDLLGKYSVEDILMHLAHVNMVNINGQWRLCEIAQKSVKLFEKLNINLPITWNRES